jgi:hypothetical protein
VYLAGTVETDDSAGARLKVFDASADLVFPSDISFRIDGMEITFDGADDESPGWSGDHDTCSAFDRVLIHLTAIAITDL